ncbi:transporter substrate-binding domain-containing protein [uncultured Paraglaciecola sp.]|uniref:substrate-binding periplasmic protein n=1 Tax=uncultured Paraglaciecola sp. TaxID=1765024 RepID=UPI0025E320ED|nr:transporter substrate-binding domain-containing protein [uncultured Paraglaciecola sp.]
MGDDDFPPYSFTDQNQQIKGIDIDLLHEMASRLEVKLEIELVPWKRLLLMTKKGDVTGSFSLFKTPDREAFALYTHPVHYSTYKLFTTKDSTTKFDNLKDLYGKRIGIEAGFAISDEFDAAKARGDISVVEIFNFDDTFRRLLLGGIDAFAGNELVVKYKLQTSHNETNANLDIISLPKSIKKSRGGFFVLSKKSQLKDKLEWQKRISQTLSEMEEESIFEKIMQKYMQ